MPKYNEYPGTSTVPSTAKILWEDAAGATKYMTRDDLIALLTGGPVTDTVPPALQSISVQDATPNRIDLLYDENLDTGSVPPASAYSVASKTVTGVSIVGKTVRLTVNTDFVAGNTITVSYTPGTGPVRDLAHNNASAFSLVAGTNYIGTITGGGGGSSNAYTGTFDS